MKIEQTDWPRDLNLRPLPRSKKGARKFGTRVHLKGGVAYVLFYEAAPKPKAEPKPPKISADSAALMVEILTRMNQKLEALEQRTAGETGVVLPGSSPLSDVQPH